MPFYPYRRSRYYSRNRFNRKPGFRAGRSRFKRKVGFMFSKKFHRERNLSVNYAKLRLVVDVLTGATGNYTIGISYNKQPSGTAVGTSMVETEVDAAATYNAFLDASTFEGLYERVRCAGVKLKFIPSSPDDPSSATSYQPFYWSWDRTGLKDAIASTLNTVTVNDVLDEDTVKVKNLFRPFNMYKPAVHYKNYSKIPGPDSSNSEYDYSNNIAGLWHNTTVSTGSQYPHLLGMIRGGTANKNYGKLVITGYFIFQDRV